MQITSNQHMPRYKALNGRVLWLTGLSGAGKSTIAEKIQHHLLQRNITPLILDGDLVRAAVDDPHWGFDNKSRLSGSFRYSRLASLAASQGLTVIVPTISMFHDVHSWNRQNIENYFEVYLRTKEQTRRLRDPKVLYAQYKTQKKSDMVGIGNEPQAPLKPDMLIDNDTKSDEQAISDLALTITERFLHATTSK
jgi:adenylylsulfate kinase-like enzyme